jgi:hypothetical protein
MVVVVVIILIVLLVLAFLWLADLESPCQPSTPPQPVPTYIPPPPVYRPPAYTPPSQTAQVARILQQRLGVAYAAQQERVRLYVLQQEQTIAARLARAQGIHDFEELRLLHNQSRQTADQAYVLMDQTKTVEQELSASIRTTHQSRGGVPNSTYHLTLDALHSNRNLVHTYRESYLADVRRLNARTGELRDSIYYNCGEAGRAWYESLMARTEARRQGLL